MRETEAELPLARTLAEIAHTLESVERVEDRVRRVLALTADLVPYRRVAVLHAVPGAPHVLFAYPDVSEEDRAPLVSTLARLLRLLASVDDTVRSPASSSHLTVPLMGLDEVIGLIRVDPPEDTSYSAQHLRLLSVIAAQLGSYLTMIALRETDARRAEELETKNRELDSFAYTVSHDLKSPLRGIGNVVKWVSEDEAATLTAQSKNNLDLAQRRVAHMSCLIDGILNFARAGKATDDRAVVDVGALLRDIVEMLEPTPPARIEIDGPMPSLVSSRVALQQVFMNLVSNALKHAGRPDVVVLVKARDEGDSWIFTVADNGPGIAEEHHERVWKLFQSLEARPEAKGAGIGLSIVRKLVEARRGNVWIESSPGGGATFAFRWPRE